MAAKGIFCLEGLWDHDLKNRFSVQPLLTMLEINQKVKYIRQDAATIEELEFYLTLWKKSRYKNYPILYLAFHGESETLLIGKQLYTLERLSEHLAQSCMHSIIMIASCSTLRTNRENLKNFLKTTNALALCGYRAKVNWIHAAAFELMLLSSLQQIDFSGRGIRTFERQASIYGERFNDLEFTFITRREITH
ncbi:MAG: hypothetical protein GX640_03460 [Fibrobacter sp.]|nr:hypothetical protein [Fibrobacter sp.]